MITRAILHFVVGMAHDRSKEFYWKFNRPVAANMIRLQDPLLRFHKTTKGNFSGEDFQISPTISFLDDSDSLAQIMPYKPWPSKLLWMIDMCQNSSRPHFSSAFLLGLPQF